MLNTIRQSVLVCVFDVTCDVYCYGEEAMSPSNDELVLISGFCLGLGLNSPVANVSTCISCEKHYRCLLPLYLPKAALEV